ncbi:MAG: DUF721 domain-containing protein [Thermodesulfobacteriota bacterium]
MKDISQALQTYFRARGAGSELDIARLWQHWPAIVGPNLSDIAKPLGRRKGQLLIGVSDSLAMQELRFYADEILDRIGQYLGHQPFDKVAVELIKGRACLDGVQIENSWIVPEPQVPSPLGEIGTYLPEGSAIRSCYEAYVQAMEERVRNLEGSK